jgi:sodium-independent sulfate anion transporter 11
VLSPWIRRALVAGGFGIGQSSSKIYDIAAVVPHQDARELSYSSSQDIEARITKRTSDSSRTTPASEPVIETITPFFHVDLISAVNAAESGVVVADSTFDKVDVLKQV